jgi:hypothetical protein
MKLSKVALAVAGVLAIAAGSAQAGQIDSSSATLAREVIVSNSQVIRAPSKGYTFTGAIDARNNEQRLQLQWRLGASAGGNGTNASAGSALQWSRNGDVALSGTPTVLPLTQGLLKLRGLEINGLTAIGFGGAAVANDLDTQAQFEVSAFLTDNDQTLVFNITIPQGANNYVQNATFQLNADNFLTGGFVSNTGVVTARTVAGDVACVAPVTNADIEFRHYTTHFGNNQVLSGLVTDSEHVRPNQTSVGRYVNFVENLRTQASPAVQSQVDAATLRTTFIRTAGELAVGGRYEPAIVAALATPAIRIHEIGRNIDLTKIAAGLDLDYTTQYGRLGTFPVADIDDADDIGNLNNGRIELRDILITVTSPLGAAGVAAGSTVALLDAANAVIPGTATVFNASGVATYSVTSAAAAAQLATGAGAKLYYIVPGGTAEVPQNATFDVTVAIRKDTQVAGTDLREQDNACKFVLSGIGGGIKIDIRNYASFASFGTTGPRTEVRLINNSESQSADVFAQMIYADGTYGPWGRVSDTALRPREVLNISNRDLEARLTNAAPTANPFGSSTVYTQKAGATVVAGPKAGVGDRVRFVSNTGTTLRVQSFMVFPNGMILNTSDAQGVDFENQSNNRTPVTAVDAQPNSQDAINGLAR